MFIVVGVAVVLSRRKEEGTHVSVADFEGMENDFFSDVGGSRDISNGLS